MSNAYQVSVVIVNYNSGELLRKCVASIMAANQDFEIIVVDNASTDTSLDELSRVYPGQQNLHLKRCIANHGFSRACNLGSRMASGENLFFLNPDTVIENDTAEHLLGSLNTDDRVGMVGGLVLNPDGSEQAGCRRSIPTPWLSLVNVLGLQRLSKFSKWFASDFAGHLKPLPGHPVYVEAISGACMLVRREAFEQVGGFDEEYFLHCEDLDLCMLLGLNGWKILFVPHARLTHYKGGCSRTRPVFVEWQKHKGMIRFYRKFFRHQYSGVLMWMVVMSVWVRFSVLTFCIGTGNILNRLGLKK